MSLNHKIWLPHFFFLLETIAVMYPNNPNKVTIKKYYDLAAPAPIPEGGAHKSVFRNFKKKSSSFSNFEQLS